MASRVCARLDMESGGLQAPRRGDTGIDTFGGTLAEMNGDIISDYVPGERIIITDTLLQQGDLTVTGGGLLTALSSQMMGNSDFYTGAFPAEYGNATSGVFDINLKTGNTEQREYTFQAEFMSATTATLTEGGDWQCKRKCLHRR